MLNKINIHNTSCVLTCESLLLASVIRINTLLRPNRLILFREVICVYSENDTRLVNNPCVQNVQFLKLKADGAQNNQQQYCFKGLRFLQRLLLECTEFVT